VSDPVGGVNRKPNMFTSADAIPKADAQVRRGSYSVRALAGARRTGRVEVAVAETMHRQDWLAELEAIRDRQDQKAFADLFTYFAPRVKAFLMKSGAPPDVAEECAQDVMATLWRKAHMFDGTKASVATWIFTIARNRRIDMVRKSRRPEPEDLPWGPDADPGAVETMAMQQDTELLGRALATLPEKQRKLIERAYFGELSHSEIAAETGLPLGTIKSRIRLALERLRHAMK
jgi:RNA polymerase sigma factor (sigma-70 family)